MVSPKLSPSKQRKNCMHCVWDTMMGGFGALSSKFSPNVRKLGVTFDSQLKFDKHIDNVVKTSFYQLCLLAKVKPFLSRHNLEKAIHASRLDYCNALYVCISQSFLSCLQLVQNAADHLLTNKTRQENITPIFFLSPLASRIL